MPPHRRVATIRSDCCQRCWITDSVSLPSGRLQSALEGGFYILFLVGQKNLVPEPSTNQIREALRFSQFRFKLIEFLKLPFDVGERALREVLEQSCSGVYRNYLARAESVEEILRSEDTVKMYVGDSLAMDHRRSDSPIDSQHCRSSN